MCHLRLRLMVALGVITCLCFSKPAFASDPLDYTRDTLEQARAVVASDRTHNDKLAALSALFGKFLDTDFMGREALGRHWSEFTPGQQKEFLGLFRELLERTYVQKLLLFDNPKFQYVSEAESNGEARVDTNIVTPRDNFSVVYRLRLEGGGWYATLITVEDVSLTANLGSQLDHLLSRQSPEDLLTMLRKRYGRTTEGVRS